MQQEMSVLEKLQIAHELVADALGQAPQTRQLSAHRPLPFPRASQFHFPSHTRRIRVCRPEQQ